jgi:hypothetical protein
MTQRTVGVTSIAILSMLGSLLTLGVGILTVVVMFLAPAPEQFAASPLTFKVIFLLISLVYILPAAWGVITAIGLWRLRNWARISIIAFSALLILMAGFSGLMMLAVPFPVGPGSPLTPSAVASIRVTLGAFWLVLLGIGTWWLVFFTRPTVKGQFGRISTPTSGSGFELSQGSVNIMASTSNRPLSISVIAWLLLAGSLFILMSLAMRAPAILFWMMLTGWSAVAFYLIFAALQLSIGVGLLRLKPAARIGAIIYLVFGFVNSAVFSFAPGHQERLQALIVKQQSMFPWFGSAPNQPAFQFDPTPFMRLGLFAGCTFIGVQLYFLVTRKLAFETSADSARAS